MFDNAARFFHLWVIVLNNRDLIIDKNNSDCDFSP